MAGESQKASNTAARRRGGIRWHLFQVQLVSFVPIGVFAATLLYLHWQVQEQERERAQIETVRLLAAAVDNALDSTVERLSILGRLWGSGSLSEQAVYTQAKEAVASNADWANVLAFDADGRAAFRADAPFGTSLPPDRTKQLWRAVFTERRAVVSEVLVAPSTGARIVAVGVPVVTGADVSHVLVAHLDLGWYDHLLSAQGLPDKAVAALLDAHFKFVARSTEGDARRGGDPTQELVADMKLRREGLGRYTNLNGTAVYTAWTFTRHGWGVGFATPSAPVDNAFWNHLLLFGFLWAAAVAAGVVYAFAKARPVAASLEALEDQAEHFATGRRIVGLPDSRVAEVNSALAALERASVLLQSATRERDRSLETEREARAAAEAANRAKDEFIAMLGHELRNPLAAISNAASIVKSDKSTAEQLEFASAVITRQSAHLKRLIDDLLDVGRAMTGKIVLEHAPVDLAASAEHVVATLKTAGRLEERRVELDTAPTWIEGDHTRIEQILTNLLVNAARHTDPGGRIGVRVAREADSAVIEVSDDGRGIAPEHLARVFDLFFQAEATPDRAAGGLGIGLTLVQRLAKLHGGDVRASSGGCGQGATFTVRLLAIVAPEQARGSDAGIEGARAETVLVVEDNPDARESLRVALELGGHRVLQAADGPGALEVAGAEQPRLAVLDIGLPGMDGYELARRLREEFGREIVLIALTGYGTEDDERRALGAGFDRHLTKPIDAAKLADILDRVRRPPQAVA